MKLAGKVAIITGASSGLGRAGAELFAREGARVVLVGRTSSTLEAAAGEIRGNGGEALPVVCDMSKVAEIKSMIDQTVKHYGKLNIFWHNAGAPGPMGIESVNEEDYEKTMDTHVKGGFFGAKYALPELRKQGGGNILFTASLAGIRPASSSAAYSCAKAALVHLTKWLAFIYARENIRVNCVCPGNINTPVWDNVKKEAAKADVPFEVFLKSLFAGIPMGRLGEPSDIAAAALYLVSDDAPYTTGVILNVDGGSAVYSRPL